MSRARRAVDAAPPPNAHWAGSRTRCPHNNTGYDIHSTTPEGDSGFIEVKGRIAGAEDFTITLNEVLLGKNVCPPLTASSWSEVSLTDPNIDQLATSPTFAASTSATSPPPTYDSIWVKPEGEHCRVSHPPDRPARTPVTDSQDTADQSAFLHSSARSLEEKSYVKATPRHFTCGGLGGH